MNEQKIPHVRDLPPKLSKDEEKRLLGGIDPDEDNEFLRDCYQVIEKGENKNLIRKQRSRRSSQSK
jgi:hypothetical protein